MSSPRGAGVRCEPVICESAEEFVERAASRIAEALEQAIDERGQARIALSGGSTPEPVYRRLGQSDLVWSKVTASLVDERWVDETDPDSNAGLIERSLRSGPARACRFFSFRGAGDTPEAAAAAVDARLTADAAAWDVVVLGMGEDGHFASLFPGTPELEAGLDPSADRLCMVVRPGPIAPPQTRLTLTLPAILNARRLVLLVRGSEKWRTLQAAMADGSVDAAPIRAIVRRPDLPLETYWTP